MKVWVVIFWLATPPSWDNGPWTFGYVFSTEEACAAFALASMQKTPGVKAKCQAFDTKNVWR
jgi:hypothetical protein